MQKESWEVKYRYDATNSSNPYIGNEVPIGEADKMIKINRTHDVPLILDVNTLKNCKLAEMNFHRCLLNDMDFSETDLSDSDFRSAEMINSTFNNSTFQNARLIMIHGNNSFFDGCVFDSALLLHSDFGNSSFRYANFTNSVINDVCFARCDLRGANLDCEGLETCKFDGAIYDEFTIWKKEFDAAKFGAIKECNGL